MKLIKSVPNTSINKANVGEVYKIDGVHKEVTGISKLYVYLDHKPHPKKAFNCLARQVKTQQPIIKIREVEVEVPVYVEIPAKVEARKNIDRPSNALRYIVLVNNNTEECQWIFADGFSSHTTLYDEAMSNSPITYTNVIGGFYTALFANANKDINDNPYFDDTPFAKNTIILFGKSDSYGLYDESYIVAIKALETRYNVVLLDTLIKS